MSHIPSLQDYNILKLLGFLLTTSPSVGLNYPDLEFAQFFESFPNFNVEDDSYSALEHIRRRWESEGTASWGSKTVHWLMIFLITELEATPRNYNRGRTVPDIQSAYLPVVRDLVCNQSPERTAANCTQISRRASHFKRYESVKLVREYVSCIDEISQIYDISEQKIKFLNTLREQLKSQIIETPRDLIMTHRIDWAIDSIRNDNENLPRLLHDLKSSLNVV